MKYHYNAYWRTWSRRLSSNHPHGPYVEVNLTPISSSTRSWENDVACIRIRFHGTGPGRGDKDTDELPESVLAEMRQHLPEELVQRLLHEDFLSQIDYDRWRRNNNGGADLANCLKV